MPVFVETFAPQTRWERFTTWLCPKSAVIKHFLNSRWSETPNKLEFVSWKDYHECDCRKEAEFPRGGRPRYTVPNQDDRTVHLNWVQLTYFGCSKPINLKYGRCKQCNVAYYHTY